jgi:integrase
VAEAQPLTDDILKYPKRREEVVIPSVDEMNALLREIRTRRQGRSASDCDNLEAAFLIASRATMRRGELSGLLWEDVDWEMGKINIRRSYTRNKYYTGLKKPKTPQGVRSLDIDPELRAVLERINERQGRPRTGLVLRTKNGTSVLGTIGVSFATAVFKAGLGKKHGKLTLHTLRHVCQSAMTANRVPQATCMKLMGHSKSTMTMYYSHEFEDGGKAAREAIMGIGRLLNPENVPQLCDKSAEDAEIVEN